MSPNEAKIVIRLLEEIRDLLKPKEHVHTAGPMVDHDHFMCECGKIVESKPKTKKKKS